MKTISTLLFGLFLSIISYSQTYELWMVDPSDPNKLKLKKTSQLYTRTQRIDCIVLKSPALYIKIPDSANNESISIATIIFADDVIKTPIYYYTDSTRWMAITFKPIGIAETIYWFHWNNLSDKLQYR